MFDAVDGSFGATHHYARDGLGLSDGEIEALRTRLIA